MVVCMVPPAGEGTVGPTHLAEAGLPVPPTVAEPQPALPTTSATSNANVLHDMRETDNTANQELEVFRASACR